MNPIYDFIQKNRMLVKIEKAQKNKTRNLSLDDFDLTSVPDILLKCHDVRSLCLQRNKIWELPKEVGIELRGLTHLSIQYNNFESFPECLKNLALLVTLNISHNPIKDLTKDIGCLTSLEVIWCNYCCLTSLPEELQNLQKMETFGARNNKINKLPDGICHWENLRWLSLEGNDLHSVPKDFHKLKSLIHLNLNRNNFSYIPEPITKIDSLRYLHLQRNFFVCISESTMSAMPHVKINLLNNPLIDIKEFKVYNNVIFTGSEKEFFNLLEVHVDTDESSDDWENSLHSLELTYSTTDTSDSDDEEVIEKIPKLSKYFVTY